MVLIAWAFSRWMALIYLFAFWSLGLQIQGLIGQHGILPVDDFLKYIQSQTSVNPYWAAPTLCWINHSDTFLLFLCWAGVGLSILLLLGFMPGFVSFLLWLFYLSLTTVGQDFLGFQWDNLLLEAGFLLIFLFPKPLALINKTYFRPSLIIVWLLRWLLFRLMFESGMVKLLSGDANWSHLTALTYHFWTQPLPNAFSWYMAQLPVGILKFSCAVVFIIELIFPFLIFFGRWPRLIAFFGIVGLQLLIMLTGNYCFFNLLAIGLSLTLLEDEHLSFLKKAPLTAIQGGFFYQCMAGLVAVVISVISLSLMADSFLHITPPKPIEKLITLTSPYRSINNYGLFAVMTTQRNEIIIEGSDDGDKWIPYEFYYKPGDVNRAPGFTGPFQPRLDWQMWFASLGSWQDNQWVVVLMQRLLEKDPAVEKLFALNPFPTHPPRYIEATYWSYQFTDFKTKGFNGPWWRAQVQGLYCPTLSSSQ